MKRGVGRSGEPAKRLVGGERRMKKYERKNKKVISKMFSGKERSGPGGWRGGGEVPLNDLRCRRSTDFFSFLPPFVSPLLFPPLTSFSIFALSNLETKLSKQFLRISHMINLTFRRRRSRKNF